MILYIGKLPSRMNDRDVTKAFRHLASEYVFSNHNTARLLETEKYLKKYLNVNEPIRNTLLNITNSFTVGRIEDEYVATIPDQRLDTLARLITYGNLSLRGSDILNKALDYATFYM